MDETIKDHHKLQDDMAMKYMMLYIKYVAIGGTDPYVNVNPSVKAMFEHGVEAIGAFEEAKVVCTTNNEVQK